MLNLPGRQNLYLFLVLVILASPEEVSMLRTRWHSSTYCRQMVSQLLGAAPHAAWARTELQWSTNPRPVHQHQCGLLSARIWGSVVLVLELQTKVREDFTITKKGP